MEEKELRELLLQRLYLEYMLFKDSMLQNRKEDTFYEELRGYAYSELEAILENGDESGRKDGGDGKKFDQAA